MHELPLPPKANLHKRFVQACCQHYATCSGPPSLLAPSPTLVAGLEVMYWHLYSSSTMQCHHSRFLSPQRRAQVDAQVALACGECGGVLETPTMTAASTSDDSEARCTCGTATHPTCTRAPRDRSHHSPLALRPNRRGPSNRQSSSPMGRGRTCPPGRANSPPLIRTGWLPPGPNASPPRVRPVARARSCSPGRWWGGMTCCSPGLVAASAHVEAELEDARLGACGLDARLRMAEHRMLEQVCGSCIDWKLYSTLTSSTCPPPVYSCSRPPLSPRNAHSQPLHSTHVYPILTPTLIPPLALPALNPHSHPRSHAHFTTTLTPSTTRTLHTLTPTLTQPLALPPIKPTLTHPTSTNSR